MFHGQSTKLRGSVSVYDAPQKLASWMSQHRHKDRRYNQTYLYHSRSDRHSVELCRLVVADLLNASGSLRDKAAVGKIAYGVNVPYQAPSGKVKNLDFAIGTPKEPITSGDFREGELIACVQELESLEISCEAKSTMTEHSKSQPRMYDELSSSHEIIHQGAPSAIATGIAVINIAATFVSPLRQTSDTPYVTKHKQPKAAGRMIEHLRGLKIRDELGGVGFEAFCTIVLDCDNVSCANLWTDPPAPQPGDLDHYQTYVARVVRFYDERFS